MKHHTYQFNDQIYHQKDGTPIGLQIAVNISRLVMVDWDQQMMTVLITNNIRVEFLMRYVDDVNIIARIEVELGMDSTTYQRQFATKVTQMADSIFSGIIFSKVMFAPTMTMPESLYWTWNAGWTLQVKFCFLSTRKKSTMMLSWVKTLDLHPKYSKIS